MTSSVSHRVKQHNEGKGSKYVRSRLPAVLVMRHVLETKSLALKAEAAFKNLTKAQKEEMVRAYVCNRAKQDAYLDLCENCPWASVGGKGMKPPDFWVAPDYITTIDAEAYVESYKEELDSYMTLEVPNGGAV